MKKPDEVQPSEGPSTQIEDFAEANPRLLQAVREYQAATDAGQKPNRRLFLAGYADIAEELAECLDGLDFVHTAAPRLTGSDVPRSGRETAEMLTPEQPLGDFRIVREIGRGGMGVVYEAVQLSLGRRVALKVLPLAATLDARQLQRFHNEAKAAACLHHNNIVPVFAVGSERSVHYYAMQYIEGQTLAALIADLRRLKHLDAEPASPLPALPAESAAAATGGAGAATLASQQSTNARVFFRTVAQLGVQAAEGLEHAHQMGIIHRDIKPANLLLDVRGNLWITDFGLARFQTDAAVTATGDVVGTLRYMSPEQAAGKPIVDQRTDVYSLGATLYELLALAPVFDGRNRQELLQQILDCEPAPLRLHCPLIPVDLETIVLKSLTKSPEERYATAKDLADDLQRFLEDQPIRARRPTLREKAAKWSRRHRTLVGAGVVLLAAAVVGLSVLTIAIAQEQAKTEQAYQELQREQQRTKAALASEMREHTRAEKNLDQARRVLDFFTQITQEDLAGKPGLEAVRQKVIEALLAYYKDFIEEYRDDTHVREELAATCWQFANLLNEVGARAEAVAMLEQARRFYAPPPGGPGGPNGFGGPGGPPRPGPPPGGPPLMAMMLDSGSFSMAALVVQAPVQQDLKLSQEQVKEIERLQSKERPPPPRMRGRGDPEHGGRPMDLAALERALPQILRPDQTRRLQQLIWQQRGTHALSDQDVAEALDLTEDQRERIHTIQDEARKNRWGGEGGRSLRSDMGRRSEEFWKNVGEKTLLVLTVEQRSKWKTMMGEPFQGEVRFWPPRPEPRN